MDPYWTGQGVKLYCGDAQEVLASLPDGSVQCVVTSPPYWGLRDYGGEGQLGLESTLAEYVEKMVQVFCGVRRVLREDGTLWLNLGDTYASAWPCSRRNVAGQGSLPDGRREARPPRLGPGLKDKDLVGIPWRVAFALQADGWYLRSDIIWSKPNPMPESVTDRPTKSHEYIFLLTRSGRYFYDASAIREAEASSTEPRRNRQDLRQKEGWAEAYHGQPPGGLQTTKATGVRNKRSVWTVATQPYPGAHFATFPEKLIEPCIKAGCSAGGTVLDPFAGSGTALYVARRLGCQAVGIELNSTYCDLAVNRLAQGVLDFGGGS